MTRLFLICLLISAVAHAAGTVRDGNGRGYSRRLYGIANGLPEQTVQAFAQTPDHYLWIGTTGGLARFDGQHFTVFDRENTAAFEENSVFSLLAARDGTLWIGTEGSGLLRYRDGVFTRIDQRNGLTDMFVRALAQDAAGILWVGTNNGIFRINASSGSIRLERLDATAAIPPLAVNAICADTRGRLWLGGSRLAVLDQGNLTLYALPGDAARNRVKAIAETSGAIWVGTVSGLYRMLPGERHFTPVPGIHGTTRGLRPTSDGRFWVSILGRGTIAYRVNQQNELVYPDVIPSDTVLAVYEDMEQNVWLGMESGMLRLRPTPISIVALERAGDSDFGTVYQDREGRIWSAGTRLYRLHNGVPELYTPSALAGMKVRELLEDRDSSTWFGTDGSGLVHIAGSAVRHYTTPDGLANNFIRALLQARDGTLWIGTDEGVSHFDGHSFTNYQMKDGLAYQSVRSMLQDENGDLWIGTELGLSHLHSGTFASDAAVKTLRQDKIWALHQDSEGSLWIGTRNNGLFRFHNGALTHFRVADGLASSSIYDIQEDASGRFWMSGPDGISLVNRHDLDAFADGRTDHLSLTFYGTSTEAEGVQIFGGMQTAGVLTPEGDVWYPSNRGLIHIVRSSMLATSVAPLVINSVRADGRELPAFSSITLPPGNSRLELNYASVMMRPQDALRFKYRLEGLEQNWNNAGTRHVADYTNIPPGRYTFQVASYDLSRPDALSIASLAVTKRPHFYRTWWFLAVCVLALAALVLAVHRARLARMRRHFQAVLQERNRLAREVHDTILQGCTGVSAVLEAVSSLESEETLLKQQLVDSARQQIRVTINEAREAVWALRHEGDAAEDLPELMNRMRLQLSRDLGVAIQCDVEGQPFPINRPVAHELMMIAREAVHNAANHASPTVVRLKIDFQEGDIAVAVADDGCGFSPDLVATDGMHFGLVGMRERAARLGATLDLTSVPSAGTLVTVRIPRTSKVVGN